MRGLSDEDLKYIDSFEIGDEVIIKNNLDELDNILYEHFSIHPGVMKAIRDIEGKKVVITNKFIQSGYNDYRINLNDFIYSGLFFKKNIDKNGNYLLELV